MSRKLQRGQWRETSRIQDPPLVLGSSEKNGLKQPLLEAERYLAIFKHLTKHDRGLGWDSNSRGGKLTYNQDILKGRRARTE